MSIAFDWTSIRNVMNCAMPFCAGRNLALNETNKYNLIVLIIGSVSAKITFSNQFQRNYLCFLMQRLLSSLRFAIFVYWFGWRAIDRQWKMFFILTLINDLREPSAHFSLPPLLLLLAVVCQFHFEWVIFIALKFNEFSVSIIGFNAFGWKQKDFRFLGAKESMKMKYHNSRERFRFRSWSQCSNDSIKTKWFEIFISFFHSNKTTWLHNAFNHYTTFLFCLQAHCFLPEHKFFFFISGVGCIFIGTSLTPF